MSFFSRLLDYDPDTKTKTIFHSDGEGGYTIETLQDVTELVEYNKARYNNVDQRARWGEKAWVAASLPPHVYMDLKMKGIADDEKKFKAWLNDPENLYYRTRPGRV
ncbi:MAG: hypothetical protein K0S14_32 [Thermomicrobiales bacterium]|nr:hypothetical protein [Thermomicrobiales bacterium]